MYLYPGIWRRSTNRGVMNIQKNLRWKRRRARILLPPTRVLLRVEELHSLWRGGKRLHCIIDDLFIFRNILRRWFRVTRSWICMTACLRFCCYLYFVACNLKSKFVKYLEQNGYTFFLWFRMIFLEILNAKHGSPDIKLENAVIFRGARIEC